MAVDYTPTLGNYTELKPFRYWCQKVLPLVYDDTLSYYELLCKVVDYLNKTMEDVETLHDDVVDLHTAYEQLQSYVNDYFDNLDVQEEINNKLNSMATDGTLSALMAPYISDDVAAWLAEHITPTTPAIDDSLSVSGAGADAKKTGENFGIQYDATKTYHKGDYVLYDGNIYICNSDNVTGVWNSDYWLQTDLSTATENISDSFNYDFGRSVSADMNKCVFEVCEKYSDPAAGNIGATGYWEDSETNKIDKFVVISGETICIKKNTNASWQFMSDVYFPTSPSTISHFIGEPCRRYDRDMYIVVPEEAVCLMYCRPATDDGEYVFKTGRNYMNSNDNTILSGHDFAYGSYYGPSMYNFSYSKSRLRTISPIRVIPKQKVIANVGDLILIMCTFDISGNKIAEYTMTNNVAYTIPDNAYYALPIVKQQNNSNFATIPDFTITFNGITMPADEHGNICSNVIHGNSTYIDLNGTEVSSTTGTWDRTEYFRVMPGTTYNMFVFTVLNKVPINSYVAYYDSEYRFIDADQLSSVSSFTTPDNAYYAIVSGAKTHLRYTYVTKSPNVPKIYTPQGVANQLNNIPNDPLLNIISYAKNGLNPFATEDAVPIYPHGSKYSFIGAKYAGYNGVLVDVIESSDGHFMVSHDDDISVYAKADNGDALKDFKITGHTMAELKAVDMGYDYGTMYRGTRIQELKEVLPLIKALGLYLIIEPELDPIGSESYTELVEIVKEYGFTNNVTFFAYEKSELEIAKSIIPNCGLMIYAGSSEATATGKITDAISLKTDINKVYVNAFANLTGQYANILTNAQIETMIDNDIDYCISSTGNEPTSMITFLGSAPHAYYASMIGTQLYPADKIIYDNILSNL